MKIESYFVDPKPFLELKSVKSKNLGNWSVDRFSINNWCRWEPIIKVISKVDIKYLFHAFKKINIKPQGYRRHFSIFKNEIIKIPDSKTWIKTYT